jgi:hypothetical protein
MVATIRLRRCCVWVLLLTCLSFGAGAVSTGRVDEAANGCLACASGENVGCPTGSHKAWSDDDDAVWGPGGGAHESCVFPSCSTGHGLCELEGASTTLVDTVEKIIAAGSVSTLRTLLSTNEQVLSVNVPRSAVQVAGCQGQPIAHLRLSEAVITSLLISPEAGSSIK